MDMDETFCHDLCQGNFDAYINDAINHPKKQAEICFKCVEDFIEDYVNDYRKQLYHAFDDYVQNCKDDDVFQSETPS